ncbi:MAG: hypothetical protein GX488_11095 [Clostridiales bacterium]|nr:hypothetical protein [Clostridiales bacterium]
MRDKRWILPTILSIALVLSVVWGYNQLTDKKQLQPNLTNDYQRLFYDA